MICKECGEDRKHKAKGMCHMCYKKKRYHEIRYKKNKDELDKRKDSVDKLNNLERQPFKKQTCDLVKKHHEDLKDDPESLSTDFLKKLINVECDDDL